MISRNHNDIIFECDACGDTLETMQADWNSAWNTAKRQGWRSKKMDGAWEHYCGSNSCKQLSYGY